ncbi:MAG: hypothetical protein ACPG77_10710 [Nannocystaceae bacterium]
MKKSAKRAMAVCAAAAGTCLAAKKTIGPSIGCSPTIGEEPFAAPAWYQRPEIQAAMVAAGVLAIGSALRGGLR